MNIRLTSLITTLLLVAASLSLQASRAEESNPIDWITDAEQGFSTAQRELRPVLLFVTADRCRYCEKMKQTYSDPAVSSLVRESFVPITVNADQETQLVRKLGIESFPTTMIIYVDTEKASLLDRVIGYLAADAMQTRLTKAISRTKTR